MIAEEYKEEIRNHYGNAFFDAIEKYFRLSFYASEPFIPYKLKNILILQGCDNAVKLAALNSDKINDMELFMQEKFIVHMITNGTVEDYLGIFINDQKKFEFLVGEKIILQIMKKICKKVIVRSDKNKKDDVAHLGGDEYLSGEDHLGYDASMEDDVGPEGDASEVGDAGPEVDADPEDHAELDELDHDDEEHV